MEDPLKTLLICKNILRKRKINLSPYNLVIHVRHFKTFFLWSRENINYIWKCKTLVVPDLCYYKTLRINYFYTYKTCSGNNNCIASFDHPYSPAHLLASKFDNPAGYLQYKCKSWVEALQVQTYYLTKTCSLLSLLSTLKE